MYKYDIRTAKEKERDARNARIRAEFEKMKLEMPDVANVRIFNILAERYGLVWPTVRKIVLEG